MKYRYIKITMSGKWWGFNDLSENNMAQLRAGGLKAILDLQEFKIWQHGESDWQDIKGDA